MVSEFNLGDLGIRKRFRDKRGGRNRNSIGNLVAQSTGCPHPIVTTKGAPTIRNPAAVPTLLVSNTRSLASKISELQCVPTQNSADIVCITETWLTDNIINDAVSLSGYNLFRKDRRSRGGGIAVYISSSTRAKQLDDQELSEAVSESLWIELRPTRLPRPISAVLIGTVYHPHMPKQRTTTGCAITFRKSWTHVSSSTLIAWSASWVTSTQHLRIFLRRLSNSAVALRKLCE